LYGFELQNFAIVISNILGLFMIHTSKLPGVQLYGRSSQLPGFDNTPVTVDHMNGYVKVKGKTKWNDITIQCYHFEGITTIGLWAYFNGQHQLVQLANDRHPDVYKHDMQIWMLNPAQAPLGRWKLVGAFISSLSSVSAEIVESGKGTKIRVAKFKAKVRYRRVTGFRPMLSKLKILSV
jgi:hypothetical protein